MIELRKHFALFDRTELLDELLVQTADEASYGVREPLVGGYVVLASLPGKGISPIGWS